MEPGERSDPSGPCRRAYDGNGDRRSLCGSYGLHAGDSSSASSEVRRMVFVPGASMT